MINFNQIQNLSEIHSEYECFFIDLWGVIHNGVNLFENVLDTLKFLKSKKKERIPGRATAQLAERLQARRPLLPPERDSAHALSPISRRGARCARNVL